MKEHPFTTDTLAQWCAGQQSPRHVLDEVIKYNHRLGVWLTSQVTREALIFVHEGDLRALEAIQAAEAWAIDPSEHNELLAKQAMRRATVQICSASTFAIAAAYAAPATIFRIGFADNAASYTAAAFCVDVAAKRDEYRHAFAFEEKRLCGVIARAIPKAMALIAVK